MFHSFHTPGFHAPGFCAPGFDARCYRFLTVAALAMERAASRRALAGGFRVRGLRFAGAPFDGPLIVSMSAKGSWRAGYVLSFWPPQFGPLRGFSFAQRRRCRHWSGKRIRGRCGLGVCPTERETTLLATVSCARPTLFVHMWYRKFSVGQTPRSLSPRLWRLTR